MKLWYQSMSRQAEWGGYPRTLRDILDKVRDPDTEIHVAGITEIGGTGDQFRYLEYLETGEVLKNVHRAVREGFDAFLIGNIADPGLQEAREIADIPVLGLCELALHVACMMGASFSLVTINEKFTPRIVENVRRYGLHDRLAAVNRMQVERLTDLGVAFDDADARERIVAQFNRAARANAEAGAEVVIAAGGVVMALLAHADIHEAAGMPILNGITNLVKLGEMAVKMNRLMGGRFTSKRCTYAPPPADQIGEFRKHYGADIYPTVKEVSMPCHRGDGNLTSGGDAVLAPRMTWAPMTAQLLLRTALGKSPLVRALKEGTVASDRVGFDFVEVDPVTRAFRRMTRAMEFDLCEIALTTHAQARALRQADHRAAGRAVARPASWRADLPARLRRCAAPPIWWASASACAPGRRPPASGYAASCGTSTASHRTR